MDKATELVDELVATFEMDQDLLLVAQMRRELRTTLSRANEYLKTGQTSPALAGLTRFRWSWEQLLVRRPVENATITLWIGTAYYQNCNLEMALQALQYARYLDPSDVEIEKLVHEISPLTVMCRMLVDRVKNPRTTKLFSRSDDSKVYTTECCCSTVCCCYNSFRRVTL